MDPKGKVALITGGARIGRTVAASLAARGCSIAVTWHRSKQAAGETVKEARGLGVQALAVQTDLTKPGAPAAVVQAVRSELGRLDILIPMASTYEKTRFTDLDEESWNKSVDLEMRSTYNLALAAAPAMQTQGAGRIIAFADWLPASGRPRYKGWLPYYVAKAGIIGLVEALALELAPKILVNAIAPGPTLKPDDLSEKVEREVMRVTPLGRWGGPGEMAHAVQFLIEAEFITGECIRVDGGRHLN